MGGSASDARAEPEGDDFENESSKGPFVVIFQVPNSLVTSAKRLAKRFRD